MPKYSVIVHVRGYQTYVVDTPNEEDAWALWHEGELVDEDINDYEVIGVEPI